MTAARPPDDRDGAWRGLARWGASLIVVLLAHGAIAAGLMTWPRSEDQGAPPSSPILINLAPAATPIASTEDVSKLIPETEPPEPPTAVRNPVLDMLATPESPPEVKIEIAIEIPPPEPPPPVDLKSPPPKVAQPPPPKPPEKVAAKRAEPSRAPPSAAPVAAAAGSPSPAPPAAAAQASPQAVASWRSSLLAHLARHRRYPGAAQSRGDEGVVYLRFTMTRQGAVLAQSIERPSGHELLDREAADLVRRAQPLPSPPADLPGDRFEFVMPIQFRLR
ncbi:MAG: energy transducer TonB [Alphaproteobacteria bacterium]|nr:energy transducer TonB [Alphaproteobacteria bacterium]